MSRVRREVWHCDQCGWDWIPRGGKEEPACCPNRKCRSRKWNVGGGEVQRGPADVQRSVEEAYADAERTLEQHVKNYPKWGEDTTVCTGCGWEIGGPGYCPNCGKWNGDEAP